MRSSHLVAGAIRDEWRRCRFAWSPEGAATVAALPELADRGMIRPGDRVVLVNTAAAEKYLPSIRNLLDGGLSSTRLERDPRWSASLREALRKREPERTMPT